MILNHLIWIEGPASQSGSIGKGGISQTFSPLITNRFWGGWEPSIEMFSFLAENHFVEKMIKKFFDLKILIQEPWSGSFLEIVVSKRDE